VTDPNSYKARLEAKLQPARVRATLAFAGLFQVTHEMLKSMVLDDVKCSTATSASITEPGSPKAANTSTAHVHTVRLGMTPEPRDSLVGGFAVTVLGISCLDLVATISK
jgi:hypothetical protein